MWIKQDYDFGDLANVCWGQAREILEEISDADKEDALMDYIGSEEFWGGIPTLTEVNDILTFDWERVFEYIGMVSWDELSDLVDSKLIDSNIKDVEDFIDEMKSNTDDYDEGDIEDAEQTLNALEHLVSEIEKSVDDKEITEDLTVIIGVLGNSYNLDRKCEKMISDISSWISDHE